MILIHGTDPEIITPLDAYLRGILSVPRASKVYAPNRCRNSATVIAALK